MHNPKLSKKFFIPLLFLICFLTFLVVRTLTYSYFINRRFRACTNTIFTTDISGNPLNLHYTLAYPESSGIKDYSLSLGTFDPTQLSGQKILLENRFACFQGEASDRRAVWDRRFRERGNNL